MCDSLGLNPNPNNGTLRLPLKPVGLHSPDTAIENPPDPVKPIDHADATTTTVPDVNAISISPIESSSAADPKVVPPHMVGVDPTDPPVDRPVAADEGSEKHDDKNDTGVEGLWDNLIDKLEGFKGWLEGLIGGSKGGEGEKGSKK